MGKITLHSDSTTSATSVSNIFIDEYMTDANGEFVKIYLYLLRLMNAPEAAFSISSIADRFEHTEKDIRRALSYWERMHLLRLEYDSQNNLTGVYLLDSVPSAAKDVPTDSTAVTADARPEEAVMEPEADDAAPARKSYTADDILAFTQSEDATELLFITERYLGRTLTPTDTDTILYFYDGLGFSTDLIEYLVEYCVSKGHTSIRYIEKVALRWAEDDITSVEQAKQASNLHNQTYFTVMRALGITGRNLVPAETAFIDKWKNTYGFSSELISEACQRTIQATHQPSFEYTDSILTNWLKKDVKSPADIARLDAEFQSRKKPSSTANAASANTTAKNKFNNFEQRSYDYNEMERMLLSTGSR
uniref:DnaD domain protein n=1 Tax=Roseburia sp. TaxID=2049040 RepID=UPI003FF06D4D